MKSAPEKQSQPNQSTPEEPPLARLEGHLLDALADDFEKHGRDVVEKVRLKSPDVYLRVIAAMLCEPGTAAREPMLAAGDRAEAQETIGFLRRAHGMTRQ